MGGTEAATNYRRELDLDTGRIEEAQRDPVGYIRGDGKTGAVGVGRGAQGEGPARP